MRKKLPPISFPNLPDFPGFFLNFEFSCKNDIRSVYMVYGVGRYGIFPFLLSSLALSTLQFDVVQPPGTRTEENQNPSLVCPKDF